MIRKYRDGDHAEWLRLRGALWEDFPDNQQVREMEAIMASEVDEVFFAGRPGGKLCGLLEAGLRSRANGWRIKGDMAECHEDRLKVLHWQQLTQF